MDGQKLRTLFMNDFTDKFIGDSKRIRDPGSPSPWPDPEKPGDKLRIWPEPGKKMPGILTDYGTFVNVLMTVGKGGTVTPAPAPGSKGDQILQYLTAQNWPNKTPVLADGSPLPPEYAKNLPMVHLLEIAVIQDRLLAAINSFDITGGGKGGDGSQWPPH